MDSIITSIASIVAAVFSISSIVIAIISLTQTKKAQIISGVTQNRIHWIEDVRALAMDFIAMFIQQKPSEELEIQMHKIELYMRNDVNSYKRMITAMEKCCSCSDEKDRNKLLDELTLSTQEVLAEVWRRIKIEAGMNKKTDNKFSSISINNY